MPTLLIWATITLNAILCSTLDTLEASQQRSQSNVPDHMLHYLILLLRSLLCQSIWLRTTVNIFTWHKAFKDLALCYFFQHPSLFLLPHSTPATLVLLMVLKHSKCTPISRLSELFSLGSCHQLSQAHGSHSNYNCHSRFHQDSSRLFHFPLYTYYLQTYQIILLCILFHIYHLQPNYE